MSSSTDQIVSDWENMGRYLEFIQAWEATPSAPIPVATPTRVQLLCTQAYTRGKLAARDTSILGPQVDDSDSDIKKLVLETYFSLGLEASLKLKLPVKKVKSTISKLPDEFHGDKSKFWAFFSQVLQYFAANPSKFPSEKAKIIFAASLLCGPAYDWVEPYFNKSDGSVAFESYRDFIARLKVGFSEEGMVPTNPWGI
ncbi:hypothetical protein HI914_02047 [Erysiphe necator]|nr:hypothetical protein HI914_02047 [Erysiphe necator]